MFLYQKSFALLGILFACFISTSVQAINNREIAIGVAGVYAGIAISDCEYSDDVIAGISGGLSACLYVALGNQMDLKKTAQLIPFLAIVLSIEECKKFIYSFYVRAHNGEKSVQKLWYERMNTVSSVSTLVALAAHMGINTLSPQ